MFLDKKLKKLESFFRDYEKQNGNISEKSVGWHIDHALRSLIVISDALERSNPADYRREFNFTRLFVHTTGIIPRGKGKSPEAVQPYGEITQEGLLMQLKEAKNKLKGLNELALKSNFKHPYFGMLHLKQARRFMLIHTRHHLKIIRDIMR